MSTKEKITHNVKKFGDGKVAVLNSIDQKTGNEYVKTFTKHHDGKTVIVTKYVGYKTVSADTSVDTDERSLSIQEHIEETKGDNRDALIEFRKKMEE